MKMCYFTFTSSTFIIFIISNLLKGISLNIHFKTASGAGWPGFLTVPQFPYLQDLQNLCTSGLLSGLTEFQILRSGPDE